jgi:hypothetical protein
MSVAYMRPYTGLGISEYTYNNNGLESTSLKSCLRKIANGNRVRYVLGLPWASKQTPPDPGTGNLSKIYAYRQAGQQQQRPAANPTAQQPSQPYGFANRLSDIWNMLINQIKLWWYKSKMQSGAMSDDEWKTVQTAAKELGSNKTARELGNWYDPKKYGASYFDGLANFTAQLPTLHKLRSIGNTGSAFGKSMPGVITKFVKGALSNSEYGAPGVRSAMDWGHKYGYINKDDYDTYNNWFPVQSKR